MRFSISKQKNLSPSSARLNPRVLAISGLLLAISAVQTVFADAKATEKSAAPEKILFDDFSYSNPEEMGKNGWTIRTAVGHPGITNSKWGSDGISLIKDEKKSGNSILRMTAITDTRSENSRQTQFCHQRKYFEGTYASRVFFRNTPDFGPKGDQIVETFYLISPLKAPMDLDYSEADFEYLANGGWGAKQYSMFNTTWETFQLEPWNPDNVHDVKESDMSGWHTLVLQIANQRVKYYIDGKLYADHGDKYYPEVYMSINFNLWFIKEGLINSKEARQYSEDVDWVFHQADVVLTPEQVDKKIQSLQKGKVSFRDTVPVTTPAYPSPCDI
jgi:hypothetical protein